MPANSSSGRAPDRIGGALAVDKSALARFGESVRRRLRADPAVWEAPVDKAEVFAMTGFLEAAECARFMAMVDEVARPSPVFDDVRDGQYRTSYSGDVDPSDPFVRMIERRIDDLLGLPNAHGETVQGQRYMPGQQFHAHRDWFDPAEPYWDEQAARGGQRSWTAMIFLNDVAEGGETTFPDLGMSITPQQGTLLAWNNMRLDGTPNFETLHAALPPVSGTKYVITKWYRARPWR